MRNSSRISSAVSTLRLSVFTFVLAALWSTPSSAGLMCAVSIAGGSDQLGIIGSRFSLPLEVRYESNATGPASIDVQFFNCNVDTIRLHPTSPETGGFNFTVLSVPDGGTAEVLASIDSGVLDSFGQVCVNISDGNGCAASTIFNFQFQSASLASPNPNPVVFVGQPFPLEVAVDPPQPGFRIVWELVSGSGFLGESSTFSDGIGQSSNDYFPASPGAATVKAWLGDPFGPDVPSGTGNTAGLVTFNVGIFERILEIVSGDNQSAQSNTQVAQPLRVSASISDGFSTTPEPGVQVSFGIKTDGSGGATLVDHATGVTLGDGSTAVRTTDGSGEAQVGLRMGPETGGVLVCFDDVDGLGSGGCFNATATTGQPATLVILSGNNQEVAAGETFAPLRIGTSPPGVIMPGTPAQWQILSGNATVDGDSATITEFDSNGVATVTAQAGQGPSDIVVRAFTSEFAPVDFNLSIRDPIVREMIEISGNNQTAQPGEVFADALVIQLLSNGVPVADVPVRWQRIQGTGTIEPDGADLVVLTSGSDGMSSVTVRAPEEPGFTRIRADADGFGAILFDLTASTDAPPPPPGGIPIRLELISGGDQNGASGTAGDQPVVVRVTLVDEDSTPLVGQRVDWVVLSGSATLSGANSFTDTDGFASITFTYGEPGDIVISASIPNTQATVEAAVSSFQPVVRVVSGNDQVGDVSTPLPLPLVVGTAPPGDPAPKGLGGIVVTWSVVEGGGSLASATTETGTDGTSSNSLTLGSSPGINRVRAEVAGSPPVFFEATGLDDAVPPGAVLVIVSGDGQALPTNDLSAPLVVEARDGAGNPLPGARLRWTPGANSSVAIESELTDTGVDGRSSNRARILRPGRNTVQVSFADISGGSSVEFAINAGIINTSGLTERDREVAGALDDVCARLLGIGSPTAEQADLIAVCRGLIDGSGDRPGEVRDVLRELMPDEMLTTGRMALQMGAAQFDNLKTRMAALRGGASGVSFGGLAMRGDNGVLPLGFLDTLLFGANPDDEVGADFSRWAFFLSGSFGRGDKRVTEREAGFEFDSWSITGGVDYRYSNELVLGIAAGYNSSDTDLVGNTGSLSSEAYSMSLYSTWYRQESFYLDAVLTLGRNDFDLDRSINFTLTGPTGTTTYNQMASSSVDGSQTAFSLSAGRDFNRDGWTFGPYVRATLARQKIDGFTETITLPGSGTGLAFRVDDRSLTSRSGVLGGKVNYAMSTSWGVLLPHFQVEYQREFQDDEQDVVVRFLHDPGGTPFVLRGDAVDRDFLNIGLGLSAVFANGRSAFIFYERTSGLANQTRENIALGLRIEF